MSQIRSKSGDMTTDLLEIKVITREYYMNSCKSTNWMTQKKWRIFLRHINYLIQEEIQNLNRPLTSKAIESVIKNNPTKKAPHEMASLVKSTKH